MKLYYCPHACSKAPNITLRELGLPFDMVRVDLKTKKTENGDDYLAINPKGYVPALALDNGNLLTEVEVILQYLADQKPEAGLAPAVGTFERIRMQEWLSYISSELHKTFGMLFNPQLPEQMRAAVLQKLSQRLGYVSLVLGKQDYLLGKAFTIADIYLFTVLGWSQVVGVDLTPWPIFASYMEKIAARPAVAAATQSEA